jgi:hypothetical protein
MKLSFDFIYFIPEELLIFKMKNFTFSNIKMKNIIEIIELLSVKSFLCSSNEFFGNGFRLRMAEAIIGHILSDQLFT